MPFLRIKSVSLEIETMKKWKQLTLQCEEGHLGWLRVDDTLFQQYPNVLKGSIIGYGKIGPYTPDGIK